MRASDRVYTLLLDEIQRGVLAPGTVLGEAQQAARLGTSRTPLREAVSRLIADGLVTQQSPRITVVSSFDVADIRALFDMRRALEELAARLAAAHGTPEAFADIARAFGETDTTSTDDPHAIDNYYALIARFDRAIDASVANSYLVAALRSVRTHLARARMLARDNTERLRESAIEHRLIATAIAAGDGELAASATHVHLHNALTSILTSLPEGTP